MKSSEELTARIQELEARVHHLEREVEFLRLHPKLAQGMKGERFICEITGGVATKLNAQFDITIQGCLKLEVKFSKLNTPSTQSTRRWTWSKPMGWLDKGKDYDFLLLVGEKDYRFGAQYLDDSPYVVFLIPAAKVPAIVVSGKTIGANVNLTTNFLTVHSTAGRHIIDHMVPYALVGELIATAKPQGAFSQREEAKTREKLMPRRMS